MVDKPKVGPKDFFMWVGAMIALYVSIFSLLALFFDYIDIAYPDALNSYVDPYSGGIRYAIASLTVLFPVFLMLMHFIRRDVARDHAKKNLWIRRWILVLTIFIAAITVVVDLITLINTFLGGELTTHFILKVLVVLLVMGAALLHFLADFWGYWDINPRYAQSVAGAVGFLVIATILSGFFIIGTPGQVRLYRFDDGKVTDLQNIQYQIISYYQSQGVLPAALSDLNDTLGGYSVPLDAQNGVAYSYATTSVLSFKLCATFNAITQSNSPTETAMAYPTVPEGGVGRDLAASSWFHRAGSVCFPRTIDPKRYPINPVSPITPKPVK